ncbi:L,D-transpeptidase [Caulobacter sp. 17J65-9]|uniref:L,D-transpeptidase n=1 Tax=Caulobacter sp. 17J65-9 TaxID=2709382 RepID=UPI0013C8D110|nr:L,D-transpeptidase [Caulobacter sp. 17J65-9]NEX91944.1 L,D-transpeptidase [Caulobacter sp. 17J65-9]
MRGLVKTVRDGQAAASSGRLRTALAACALGLGLVSAGVLVTPAEAASKPKAEKTATKAKPAKAAKIAASDTVTAFADWVVARHDNAERPFVIVDKLQAAVFVYRPDGTLNAASPALIGFAPGDDSVPGIGERPLAQITPEERTTPAGRFEAGFRANGPRQVLWVDYDAAISLHPVREVTLSDPREHRLQRLKTASPGDNRITFGCINVPDAFFDKVVAPVFKDGDGIVYVLPEARPLHDVFPTLGEDAGFTKASAQGEKKGWRKWFSRRSKDEAEAPAVQPSAPG